MEPVMFKQLVDNIRTDGGLTSYPLAYLDNDDSLELLSGHHRTEAAIEAGFPEGDVIVIKTRLSEERKRAIQISHNSLTGKDDPSLLASLWEGMDLDSKRYSGLTDADIRKFGDIKLDGIGAVAPKFEETTFLFLPTDAGIVDEALKRFGKGKPGQNIHAATLETWDRFFDTIVRVKEGLKVYNSGIALVTMCELAMERLDQIDAERAAAAEAQQAEQDTPEHETAPQDAPEPPKKATKGKPSTQDTTQRGARSRKKAA